MSFSGEYKANQAILMFHDCIDKAVSNTYKLIRKWETKEGTVKICTDTRNSADVMLEKSLNFDLLLGYDAIKVLGGVLIT